MNAFKGSSNRTVLKQIIQVASMNFIFIALSLEFQKQILMFKFSSINPLNFKKSAFHKSNSFSVDSAETGFAIVRLFFLFKSMLLSFS